MLAFIPGFWEILIVLVVVLLLFGSRLPSLARSLGQSVVEFKKGVKEIGGTSGESDAERRDH
jgi:sec-independent protein translocase protein TatA